MGNHHEKAAGKGILCASQFKSPNTAVAIPNLVGNNPNSWSSKPHQVSGTCDFSYLCISCI